MARYRDTAVDTVAFHSHSIEVLSLLQGRPGSDTLMEKTSEKSMEIFVQL
jgi:hypothetical protein